MDEPFSDQKVASAELLQRNAEQVDRLEEEWCDLGPHRQIDYHCRFPDDERADRFCLKANGAGFETRGPYHAVTASMTMEPMAREITLRQEQLASFLEEGDPDEWSHLDGWSYPPKQRVQFWPSSNNKDAAKARAAVLFGGELVEDHLRPSSGGAITGWSGLASVAARTSRPSFELVPSEFLRKARAMRPADPQPTASGFSQWVYSLYNQAEGSEEDAAAGTAAEHDIWERRRGAASCNDDRFLREAGYGWSLIHNGLHLRGGSGPNHLSVPELLVKGKALRVSPDLMYARPDRSEVMIVEIKFSRQVIPKNLWPNVWAQLWCYAQLGTARSARVLTVVGEVWGEDRTRGYKIRGGYEPGQTLICLRASVRRDPRAPGFDRFFRELFNIYAGNSASAS